MITLLAHAEELHSEQTSQLEHLLTQPVSGFLIFIGGVVALAIGTQLIDRHVLLAPGVALYSLAITVATAEDFRILAIVAATTAAAAALYSLYQHLSP